MVRTVQPMKSLEFCVFFLTSFAVPCTVSRMFPPTFAKEIEVEAHAQAASEHVTWSQVGPSEFAFNNSQKNRHDNCGSNISQQLLDTS